MMILSLNFNDPDNDLSAFEINYVTNARANIEKRGL